MIYLATWPVPVFEGRFPKISQRFKPGKHLGVDIMYARLPYDSQPIADGEGSKRHIMPDGIFAIATHDGTVSAASMLQNGLRVRIKDLRSPSWSTSYLHLKRVDVRPGDRVSAGQPIGIIGDSTAGIDPAHLHFAVTRRVGNHTEYHNPENWLKRAKGATSTMVRRPPDRISSSVKAMVAVSAGMTLAAGVVLLMNRLRNRDDD